MLAGFQRTKRRRELDTEDDVFFDNAGYVKSTTTGCEEEESNRQKRDEQSLLSGVDRNLSGNETEYELYSEIKTGDDGTNGGSPSLGEIKQNVKQEHNNQLRQKESSHVKASEVVASSKESKKSDESLHDGLYDEVDTSAAEKATSRELYCDVDTHLGEVPEELYSNESRSTTVAKVLGQKANQEQHPAVHLQKDSGKPKVKAKPEKKKEQHGVKQEIPSDSKKNVSKSNSDVELYSEVQLSDYDDKRDPKADIKSDSSTKKRHLIRRLFMRGKKSKEKEGRDKLENDDNPPDKVDDKRLADATDEVLYSEIRDYSLKERLNNPNSDKGGKTGHVDEEFSAPLDGSETKRSLREKNDQSAEELKDNAGRMADTEKLYAKVNKSKTKLSHGAEQATARSVAADNTNKTEHTTEVKTKEQRQGTARKHFTEVDSKDKAKNVDGMKDLKGETKAVESLTQKSASGNAISDTTQATTKNKRDDKVPTKMTQVTEQGFVLLDGKQNRKFQGETLSPRKESKNATKQDYKEVCLDDLYDKTEVSVTEQELSEELYSNEGREMALTKAFSRQESQEQHPVVHLQKDSGKPKVKAKPEKKKEQHGVKQEIPSVSKKLSHEAEQATARSVAADNTNKTEHTTEVKTKEQRQGTARKHFTEVDSKDKAKNVDGMKDLKGETKAVESLTQKSASGNAISDTTQATTKNKRDDKVPTKMTQVTEQGFVLLDGKQNRKFQEETLSPRKESKNATKQDYKEVCLDDLYDKTEVSVTEQELSEELYSNEGREMALTKAFSHQESQEQHPVVHLQKDSGKPKVKAKPEKKKEQHGVKQEIPSDSKKNVSKSNSDVELYSEVQLSDYDDKRDPKADIKSDSSTKKRHLIRRLFMRGKKSKEKEGRDKLENDDNPPDKVDDKRLAGATDEVLYSEIRDYSLKERLNNPNSDKGGKTGHVDEEFSAPLDGSETKRSLREKNDQSAEELKKHIAVKPNREVDKTKCKEIINHDQERKITTGDAVTSRSRSKYRKPEQVLQARQQTGQALYENFEPETQHGATASAKKMSADRKLRAVVSSKKVATDSNCRVKAIDTSGESGHTTGMKDQMSASDKTTSSDVYSKIHDRHLDVEAALLASDSDETVCFENTNYLKL